MNRKRTSTAIAVGLLALPLLGAACSRPAPEAHAARPVPVEVQRIQRDTINEEAVLTGVLDAYRTVELISEVSGTLERLYADVADRIPQGAVLATIEKKVARENLNQAAAAEMAAEARYEVAREDHSRDSTLHASGDIAQAAYEASRMAYRAAIADLKATRAARELAARQLSKTDITAPFAGHVSRRYADIGTLVSPGMPLFRMVDIDSLRLVLSLAQNHVGRVQRGSEVAVFTEAFAGQTFRGRIRSVAPEADEMTRTFPVEVILPNPAGQPLRDGLVVRATLILESLVNAIALPREAVSSLSDESFVFVVEDTVATRRPVRTGRMIDSRYVIESGLREGELVVVAGMQNLRDGTRVQVEGAAAEEVR